MFTSYAQNFEDVILWRALKTVQNGFYIDIGAQDPMQDSVSLAFYEHSWRGIHVEPTQFYAERLRAARPDEVVLQAAIGLATEDIEFFEVKDTGLSTADWELASRHQKEGRDVAKTSVACMTLASVFDTYVDTDVHWLKIDVEGMEREVLESWGNSSVRPWVVLLESTIANTKIPTHSEWEDLLLRRGYEFVYFDGLNRFYVSADHKDLASCFAIGPNIWDGFSLSIDSVFVQQLKKRILALELDVASARGQTASRRRLHDARRRQAKSLQSDLAEVQNDLAKAQQSFFRTALSSLRAAGPNISAPVQKLADLLFFHKDGRPRRLTMMVGIKKRGR